MINNSLVLQILFLVDSLASDPVITEALEKIQEAIAIHKKAGPARENKIFTFSRDKG